MNRLVTVMGVVAAACSPSPAPEGLMATPFGTGAEVKFDVFHRPLPEIPLPNDFATRFDPGSPTRLRLNASLVANTEWEKGARAAIDRLDGWGTFAAISVGFTAPLDVLNLIRRHQGDDYDFRDDAVFIVDVTPGSPDFCQPVPLDMGEGNFPLVLENQDFGLTNDTRFHNQQLVFDETNEDVNRNGKLDLGEDTDVDGVLDLGNYARDTDSVFEVTSFYERETNTLIMKPVMPLRQNTVYAAVITRRLVDAAGKPTRSPFAYINHAQQTHALEPLRECLPGMGLALEDVSFTWSWTTQSITRDYVAVRDGLYGVGPMQRLSGQYPAELSNLFTLRRCKTAVGSNGACPPGQQLDANQSQYIVESNELQQIGASVVPIFFGGSMAGAQGVIENYKWVDFTAVGQFISPQFFRRTRGPTGSYTDEQSPGFKYPILPLYQQVFELDPVTGAAYDRPETVTFWVTVPKGRQGKPAPVVVLAHGYTSNKLEMMAYAGYFARMGLATLGIDCVSHGLDEGGNNLTIIKGIFQNAGLPDFLDAVTTGRQADLDNDILYDSGSDFWTAYVMHTRDVVKQSTIDHLQLIRLFRAFDGTNRWRYDVNRNKVDDDLAGDFDGDGVVDVGGAASIHITGGSLGGVMAAMVGGLEPAIETSLPIAGGAGLSDLGARSVQGGVKESVNWRMMGPVLATRRHPTTRKLELIEMVPSLNHAARLKLAEFDTEPKDGDTVIVRNLKTKDYRCSRVHSDPVLGTALIAAAVSADENDPLKLEIYAGPLPPRTPEGCEVTPDSVLTMSFDTLQFDVDYHEILWPKGTPIVAVTDGFGVRRSSPETRRFQAVAQTILESADPVNVAPFFERWQLTHGTGEKVRTRALVINTIGDMNVPVSAGVQLARAAGFVDLFHKDPRYGKSVNRVLIDNHVLEGVERVGPYRNALGQPVLLDVDHYSNVQAADDKFDVPRLSPPLRLVRQSEQLGGVTGMMMPMTKPTGAHGFYAPEPALPWDLSGFMFGVMERYMSTDGRELSLDRCNVDFSCSYFPQTPAN